MKPHPKFDRPFRSKAELELEAAHLRQYRDIGNPDLRLAVKDGTAVSLGDHKDLDDQSRR